MMTPAVVFEHSFPVELDERTSWGLFQSAGDLLDFENFEIQGQEKVLHCHHHRHVCAVSRQTVGDRGSPQIPVPCIFIHLTPYLHSLFFFFHPSTQTP